jgi:hypothetical protein
MPDNHAPYIADDTMRHYDELSQLGKRYHDGDKAVGAVTEYGNKAWGLGNDSAHGDYAQSMSMGGVGGGIAGLLHEALRRKTEQEKNQTMGRKFMRYAGKGGLGALAGAGAGSLYQAAMHKVAIGPVTPEKPIAPNRFLGAAAAEDPRGFLGVGSHDHLLRATESLPMQQMARKAQENHEDAVGITNRINTTLGNNKPRLVPAAPSYQAPALPTPPAASPPRGTGAGNPPAPVQLGKRASNAMHKTALLSWGGRDFSAAPRGVGIGLNAGWDHIYGVLPTPYAGIDIGGPHHGLRLNGPIPGIGFRSGLFSRPPGLSSTTSYPRSLWATLADNSSDPDELEERKYQEGLKRFKNLREDEIAGGLQYMNPDMDEKLRGSVAKQLFTESRHSAKKPEAKAEKHETAKAASLRDFGAKVAFNIGDLTKHIPAGLQKVMPAAGAGALGGAALGGLHGLISPGHEDIYDDEGNVVGRQQRSRFGAALRGALGGGAAGGLAGGALEAYSPGAMGKAQDWLKSMYKGKPQSPEQARQEAVARVNAGNPAANAAADAAAGAEPLPSAPGTPPPTDAEALLEWQLGRNSHYREMSKRFEAMLRSQQD